jgi:putative FmdB family regulatory protein
MPWYEYHCPSCGTESELQVPIAERDSQRCPTCGKKGLKRALSDFAVGAIDSGRSQLPPQCQNGGCPGGQCPFAG